MADTKRFTPGPNGGVVIDLEEAAERKRFIPGEALVIELAVTAAGGRTTKNTRSSPLGERAGMGWRIGG